MAQEGRGCGPPRRRPVRDRDRQVRHGRGGLRRRGPAQDPGPGRRDRAGQQYLRLGRRGGRGCSGRPAGSRRDAAGGCTAPRRARPGRAVDRGARRGRPAGDQPPREPARGGGRRRSPDHHGHRARRPDRRARRAERDRDPVRSAGDTRRCGPVWRRGSPSPDFPDAPGHRGAPDPELDEHAPFHGHGRRRRHEAARAPRPAQGCGHRPHRDGLRAGGHGGHPCRVPGRQLANRRDIGVVAEACPPRDGRVRPGRARRCPSSGTRTG